MDFLRPYTPQLLSVLRIMSGLLLLQHGTTKYLNIPVGPMNNAAPFTMGGAAGIIELVAGLLLVVGLFTRPVALLLALNLVGAIATAGRIDGGTFHLGVAPAMLVAMLFLVWAGSGRLALDRAMRVRIAT